VNASSGERLSRAFGARPCHWQQQHADKPIERHGGPVTVPVALDLDAMEKRRRRLSGAVEIPGGIEGGRELGGTCRPVPTW
jgi:hypothetical protein